MLLCRLAGDRLQTDWRGGERRHTEEARTGDLYGVLSSQTKPSYFAPLMRATFAIAL